MLLQYLQRELRGRISCKGTQTVISPSPQSKMPCEPREVADAVDVNQGSDADVRVRLSRVQLPGGSQRAVFRCQSLNVLSECVHSPQSMTC